MTTGRAGYIVSPSLEIKIGYGRGQAVGELVIGASVGLGVGDAAGPLVGPPVGATEGEEDGPPVGPAEELAVGDALGAELSVGASDGANDGKELPLGAALGSPHSTLMGSQGSSMRYAQNSYSPPISEMSLTLQASHSSGSNSSSMYTTTVTLANPS